MPIKSVTTRSASLVAVLAGLLPWIALIGLWGVSLWVRHGGLYLASDDGYVYLGYVKRALIPPRELFSYNAGEHHPGVTGFAYYYLLIAVCSLMRGFSFATRIEDDLLRGAFVANSLLLLLAAHLYLRCWRLLAGAGERVGALTHSFAFLLFCAQPKWLWAVFVGVEAPLAGVLVLLIVERLLARAPAWHASISAGLLVATRPEAVLVAWLVPFLAVATRRSVSPFRFGRVEWLRSAAATALACASYLTAALPCLWTTGRLTPGSSHGFFTRLAWLRDPAAQAHHLQNLLENAAYWQSEWIFLACVLCTAGASLGARGRRWRIAGPAAFVLAFLGLRALMGITGFHVEDRYVSFLWPLYALGIGACVSEVMNRIGLRSFHLARPAAALVALAVYAVAVTFPIRSFVERSSRQIEIVNAVDVETARWLDAHLPPSTRISMINPGGARVFTDFHLVDSRGMTTSHARTNQGNLPDFLHDHRVGWVLDAPIVGNLLVGMGAARDVRSFAPGRPFGDLHLYEIQLSDTIEVIRVTSNAGDGVKPWAVVDNNPRATWMQLTGGSSGISSRARTAVVGVDFSQPAWVDELVVWRSSAGVRGEPASQGLSFEGKRDGAWTSLPLRSIRREEESREGALLVPLSAPALLEGIRLVAHGPVNRRAERVLQELTLRREGRPYLWLWSR